jgi:hypothetical protein
MRWRVNRDAGLELGMISRWRRLRAPDIVRLRNYLVAFAGAVYQNPTSICPQNHMILPRLIKG